VVINSCTFTHVIFFFPYFFPFYFFFLHVLHRLAQFWRVWICPRVVCIRLSLLISCPLFIIPRPR
jgi:hypothetical protein